MKKIFLVCMIGVALVSCNKELNQQPISSATTPNFYQQPSDFIQGVNAVYNSLRAIPDQLMYLSETRSDNIYPTNTDAARDHDPISDFSSGIAANTYVEGAWSNDFSGIFKANTILDELSKNADKVGSVALAGRLTAEARFLRAYFYFDLVRYYGKLPIINQPVTSAEANKIPRSAVADVDTLIMADLKYAIENLPVDYSGTFPSYTASDVGRATKYAAEALLAQVYMARSGPTYNIDGPGLASNEWNLALPLLQDIISSGKYQFATDFKSIFSYSNQSPVVNKEAVFDVMYITGQNPVLGATFTWDLVPNSYFSSLPSGNSLANGSLGAPSVSYNLLDSYSSGDIRTSPTIHTTGYTFSGTYYPYPFFRKYLDTTKIPTTSRFDWGINFIAIRYTDILLLKAECILHGASGTQSDVDDIVNQVRVRAGLTTLTNVTLDQLYNERRWEFAGEGLRWFDLQRSGNLITIMNSFETSDDAVRKVMSPVVNNSVIYPVPQSQLDASPGLYTQNLGYN